MSELLERLKTYIVHKLGGMFIGELPMDIQQDYLNRKMNERIDFDRNAMFREGFSTKNYSNREKEQYSIK